MVDNSTSLLRWLWILNEIIYVRCLAQCLAYISIQRIIITIVIIIMVASEECHPLQQRPSLCLKMCTFTFYSLEKQPQCQLLPNFKSELEMLEMLLKLSKWIARTHTQDYIFQELTYEIINFKQIKMKLGVHKTLRSTPKQNPGL